MFEPGSYCKQANLGRLLACLNAFDEKAYKEDPFVLQTTDLEQNSEHVALLAKIDRELRDYGKIDPIMTKMTTLIL